MVAFSIVIVYGIMVWMYYTASRFTTNGEVSAVPRMQMRIPNWYHVCECFQHSIWISIMDKKQNIVCYRLFHLSSRNGFRSQRNAERHFCYCSHYMAQ